MNSTSEQTVKALLKKYNIRPSKGLGQNFLIDESVLHKIIKAAKLTKKDVVLEVGPGLGILTQELAKNVKRVIAIEKDKNLVPILKQNLSRYQNIKILQGDILINYHLSMINDYKVVANLPYNIALPVIRKFLEEKNPPQMMILMIQKEVAEKICAKKSSLPKIAVEFYAKPEILFYVPKDSFLPKPKVDGAVIKITNIQKNIPKINEDLFFKILKAGFAHPRKTILNNLSKKLDIEKQKANSWLKKSNIDPQKRPEDLNLKNWLNLTYNFSL